MSPSAPKLSVNVDLLLEPGERGGTNGLVRHLGGTSSSRRSVVSQRVTSATSRVASAMQCSAVELSMSSPALPAQRIEHLHSRSGETNCESEPLYDGDVMTRPLCIGPVPVRHQGSERYLHDGFVGGVEARLRANRRDSRIGEASLRRGEQPLNLEGIGRVLLKLPDLQQVF